MKTQGLSPNATLPEACSNASDAKAIAEALKSTHIGGTPSTIRRVAEVPWAAVFTSALDDELSSELAAQDAQGRRLRHLCVDEELPAFFPRRNDVLTVLHLTHLANEQTSTGVPIYGRHWARAQRLLIPGVFRNLPQAAGPAHLVCIAGIGNNDPIDASLIADFVNELDPENVYWFISPSDRLDIAALRKLAPNINFIESDLASALELYAQNAPERTHLAALKRQVLELEDLVVTVRSAGEQRALTFRAAELREFRRHLVILPDLQAQAPAPELSRRKREFMSFLSTNRQTPDQQAWQGIAAGFAFQRDAYGTLLDLVLERLAVLSGLRPRRLSDKRRGDNAPIFLAGPPASGRTVGLLWLGYHLRRSGAFVVQLLPSGGMVDNAAVEQILRLGESRGAPASVVLLDRTDRRIAANLDRHLRSAGRRALVIASIAPKMGPKSGFVSSTEDAELEEDSSQATEIRLHYALTEREIERFRVYLETNYGSVTSTSL